MKIVITGALGHIGSAFIHSLKSDDGIDLTMIDNMSAQRYCSLFNLPKRMGYKFVEADVYTVDLDELFQGADTVIHLAAITDAASSFDRKEEVERVNFDATIRVAKACLKANCNLIYPSTTSVYGVQEGLVDEACSRDQLKPQSPYAEAKLKSEDWLSNCPELSYIVLRFGTIFGVSPGMRFHTAVNKFIWQASTSQPLTVWRTAMNQKRPYLSVLDAIESIKYIIKKQIFDRKILNIVTINATVSEIIEEIRANVPDLNVNLVDTKIMNQLSYEVSNEKIKKLGFEFSGNLKREVNDTIKLLLSANSPLC